MALGLPVIGSAATACTNASLTGAYVAQVSGVNFMNALNSLNTAGGIAGSASSAGFADNPFSLSGSQPGTSRFLLDGAGNIQGQDPNAANGANSRINVGTYSVNSNCTATIKLSTGQNFSAVVVGGGSQVFFLENDADTGGVTGTLSRATGSCQGSADLPENLGFSISGTQQVNASSSDGGSTGSVSPSLFPSTLPHAAGSSFLPSYVFQRNGDADVAGASASYDGANYTFQAVANGPIGTTKNLIYTWGVDRGTHKATLGKFRPNTFFDAVVIARPDLTGEVFDNTADPTAVPVSGWKPTYYKLPEGSITIKGNTIRVVVPASLLPPKGAAPTAFTWYMAPVTTLTDNEGISEFLPATGNAAFALTGEASASGGTTGSVKNTNSVTYTPVSAIGSVQLNKSGGFNLQEVLYQNGRAQSVNTSGTYTVGTDCSLQLTFSNPAGGATGGVSFTPMTFRGAFLNSSSGVLVVQSDAYGTFTGQFLAQ